MKKILLALLLLTTSLSANAYKESFGNFGNWDSYYLAFNNGDQICAARGIFEEGYKVIFNLLKDSNGNEQLRINIENSNWSIAPGQQYVDIVILNRSGRAIFTGNGLFVNSTGQNVSQVAILVNNPNAILQVLNGYTLVIYTPNRTLSFDVSTQNVNNAIAQMATCINIKLNNQPKIIQQIVPLKQFNEDF